jgi:ubiquinone biosynthesis protein COQ9
VAEAGLSEGEAALACPKGAFDLFDAFAARADAAMLERLDDLDLGRHEDSPARFARACRSGWKRNNPTRTPRAP